MPPRASNRRATASQAAAASQPAASQAARRAGRRRPRDEEEEEIEEEPPVAEEEDNDNEDDEEAGGSQRLNKSGIERMASDLVRLALFTEYKRGPLRREEIVKKVLGAESRSFNIVMDRAQRILRKTFGMELVELMSRAERDKVLDGTANANDENVAGMRKKATSSSKTYILRSLLDPQIIEAATKQDPKILDVESRNVVNENDEGNKLDGTILAWSTADQMPVIGILHVILALILVNGKILPDQQLRAHLKKLRLPLAMAIPLNDQAANRTMSVETLLGTFVRQGYLDRQKTGPAAAGGGGRRRGRGDEDGEADVQYEWRWGSRAQAEISEDGIAQFIVDFMAERARGEDGERRRGDAQKRYVESLTKDIKRAAGGSFTEITRE